VIFSYLIKEIVMTEESKTGTTGSVDEESTADVSSEWRDLGQNLKEIFQNTWESAERQKLQEDIEAGLADFANSVNKAVDEFKVSPTGQRLKSDVEDLHERVKSGEVEGKAKHELATILQKINAELGKISKQEYDTSEIREDDSQVS
jgi:hypothetical protein